MNTIDKLNAARFRVLNTAASVNEYHNSWGVEYSFQELARGMRPTNEFGFEGIPVITLNELKQLKRETLYEYGFRNWDDNLVLIPLWIVCFIDDNEIVTSIMDDQKKLGDCDKDIRFGCIAYGFTK